jgi:hypothetical protein
MKRRHFLLLLALAALPAQGQQVTEVIELRYRNAEDVIPVLRPLLAPGGSLSALQNKLIVRTTASNLAELRKVLEVVDGVPRRLTISVRQEDAAGTSARDLEISGRVGSGRSDVQTTFREQGAENSGTVTQTVQVIEGNPVFIRVGTSVPVRNPQGNAGSRGSEAVEYRDAVTGFYAQPRVNGDQVTIQIAARRDAVESLPGAISIQRVDSVVSGKLGDWLEVGSIEEEEFRGETGIIYKRNRSGDRQRRTWLKVEKLP